MYPWCQAEWNNAVEHQRQTNKAMKVPLLTCQLFCQFRKVRIGISIQGFDAVQPLMGFGAMAVRNTEGEDMSLMQFKWLI